MRRWFGSAHFGLDACHVGVIVPDGHAAMEQRHQALGSWWRPVGDRTPDGLVDGQARLAATDSLEGPPYLELVEEPSGGVWGDAGARSAARRSPTCRERSVALIGNCPDG